MELVGKEMERRVCDGLWKACGICVMVDEDGRWMGLDTFSVWVLRGWEPSGMTIPGLPSVLGEDLWRWMED